MTYSVRIGDEWVAVPVPAMGGEPLVVPNVAAVVRHTDGKILLQRRDKPGEPVRGKLEVPGGRWRAGEPPDLAVIREVAEETGVTVTFPDADVARIELGEYRSCAVAQPVAVVNGLDGTYPSLHVLFACQGHGEPRPQQGETADPRWWPEAEVRAMLADHPDEFVDQSRAMLLAYFRARP